jgi:hypothetical protein
VKKKSIADDLIELLLKVHNQLCHLNESVLITLTQHYLKKDFVPKTIYTVPPVLFPPGMFCNISSGTAARVN